MKGRNLTFLMAILLLTLAALWVDMPGNPGMHFSLGPLKVEKELKVHLGLDLQGGLQVLLQAKMPAGEEATPEGMIAAKRIIENRINALGVSEPLIQLQGGDKIVVELPGLSDPEEAIRTFGHTGLLEFIDAGFAFLPEGTKVRTTSEVEPGGAAAAELATPAPEDEEDRAYPVVLMGRDLAGAAVGFDELGHPQVDFKLKPEAGEEFASFTRNHIGQQMAIVLDKEVISCAEIRSEIRDAGRITGNFTLARAQNLVIQLKYGALPVPLEVVENRTVGPTLGQDSVQRSLVAGSIGLGIVVFFMLAYYRLPGLLADLALVVYAALTFALFKLIPVVLTLAGIAGFILSVGMAVDANILIFERMKEELRAGKGLRLAIELGFSRAWPSIRDSNLATIITCLILFYFGRQFGASVVKGFALTLMIGVLVSMFSAIVVTRTLLRALVEGFLGEEAATGEERLKLLFGY